MPKPTRSNKLYIGIDPGKQGGIAWLRGADDLVPEYAFMPGTDTDLLNVFKRLAEEPGVDPFAVLERVRSMPGEGHAGAFTFGEGYGKLQMALTAAGIPYKMETPRSWQKAHGVTSRSTKKENKPQFKERLRAVAQRTYPGVELWSEPRTLGKQRAVCDAMLIAGYARMLRRGV